MARDRRDGFQLPPDEFEIAGRLTRAVADDVYRSFKGTLWEDEEEKDDDSGGRGWFG